MANTKNGAVIEFLSDWKKIEHGIKKREAKVSFSCPFGKYTYKKWFCSQKEIDEEKKRFKEWKKVERQNWVDASRKLSEVIGTHLRFWLLMKRKRLSR